MIIDFFVHPEHARKSGYSNIKKHDAYMSNLETVFSGK